MVTQTLSIGLMPGDLAEAQEIAAVGCVQNAYSVASRRGDSLVRACGQQAIGFVPFFAIAGAGREQGKTWPAWNRRTPPAVAQAEEDAL